ncbi:MAG TPA: alpha/beta fold hydrolase [Myxococcaceae bacterium]|nr:alpha/beta fold hydrolase [Myxococcaceae bacterium]
MRASRTSLGNLQCTVAQSTQDAPRGLVVLCHGFGATGEDLVSLAPELVKLQPALEQARFVFPAAPISLGFTGMGEGLAWWNIDFEELVARQREGLAGIQKLHERAPEGLSQSRRMLREAVDVACRQANLPLARVVLGGFSQGAMLATDVSLRLEEAPAGLCILSGTLIAEPEWRRLAPARAGLPVFQSHGTQDPLLPFSSAEALRDLLKGAGLAVDFHPFDDQHTIPYELLAPLAEYLAKRLPTGPG